jgi:hypothetical protein
VKLVNGWHGIGHTVSHGLHLSSHPLISPQHIPAVVSSDYIANGQRFSLATQIRYEFGRTSLRCNQLLQALDPAQYKALEELKQAARKKYPCISALDSIDPLLQEGKAIMWNRQTPYHVDGADPKNAWVTLMTLGEFTGGDLLFPSLNLRLKYEPGTIILFKGRRFPHVVESWEGGQRISIVHFTHESLWKEFGMTCP